MATIVHVLLIAVPSVDGQSPVQVPVVVRSVADSLPVAGALVWVAEIDAARQIVSPALFRIRLSSGQGFVQLPRAASFALIAGGIGFGRDTVLVRPDASRSAPGVTLWVHQSPVRLPPISIVSERFGQPPPQLGTGFRRTQAELRLAPAGMAVDDPIRALAVEPGIRLAEPFSSRLVVRGSDPSATATYLDGFPIHNLVHVGGFFSALPAAAVERLDVWTGPPPARYEGHGGATIDFSPVPSTEGFRGDAQISVMSAELVGGWRNAGNTLRAAGRRSWLDGVWASAVNAQEFGFGDLLLSGSFTPSAGWKVSALAFTSRDLIRDPDLGVPGAQIDSFNYRRSSSVVGVSAASELRPGATLTLRGWNSRASAGGAKNRVAGTARANTASKLNEMGVSAEFGWGSSVRYSAGASAVHRDVDSDAEYYKPAFFDSPPAHFGLAHLRSKTDHLLLRGFGSASAAVPGLGQLTAEFALSSVARDILPGLRLEWRRGLSETLQVYGTAGRTWQTTQLLVDPRQELWSEFSSVDVWLAVSDSAGHHVPAVRTDQAIGGVLYRPASSLEIRAEAWLKRSDDRGVLGAPDPDAGDALVGLQFVTERSAGIELAAHWDASSVIRLDANYSLSRAVHQSPSGSHLSNYDVPHRFQLLASVERPTGFVGSVTATLESGYPYDPYLFVYESPSLDPYDGFAWPSAGRTYVRGPHNSERLGMSHRVDAQVGYRHGTGRIRWEVFAAVANLSSGQSFPLRPDFDFRPGPGFRSAILEPVISIPPVPFVGLRLRF